MAKKEYNLSGLERWLGKHTLLGKNCRISGLSTPKTGFSADTVLMTIDTGTPSPQEIVVRIDHPGRTIFLDATIARQARMMQALKKHGAPVPNVLGWEDDDAILGAPFLVMERCEGVSLPQHPSYHIAGLLHDLDIAGRQRAWSEALETIARINRMDWRQDFTFLLDPLYGEPGLEHYLGWLQAWRRLACPAPHDVIDKAMDYLVAEQPTNMPVNLLWGDSNPGNFLFAPDGEVAAALDFEAASIGPAEVDIGWWFVLDQMLSAGNPLPDGMPDKAGQIRLFEQALQRPIANLPYFEVLAATRMALVMTRTCGLLIDAGKLPQNNGAGASNPVVTILASMIGVEHRLDMDGYMQMVMTMNDR